jgi:hypothetical protein
MTASFRLLYVFVAMEVGSRRILHVNVTAHPTAEWTTQQFREFLVFDHPYRFVTHDRDAIFSSGLDAALKGFGVRVLRTPFRAPQANAHWLEVRAEAFNVLNKFQPNASAPFSTALNTPTFGTILAAQPPRIIQFALKYVF